MKKIIPIVLIGILVLSGFGAGAVSNMATHVTIEKTTDEHILEISIDIPSIDKFQIMSYPSGQRVEMEGYDYIYEPGKPMLPSKNIMIALPPGAKVCSLNFMGSGNNQLHENYEIMPASQIIPFDNSNEECIEDLENTWQDNYDEIYLSDDFYPLEPGKMIS